jgi:small-conductance mechanosensitive channel
VSPPPPPRERRGRRGESGRRQRRRWRRWRRLLLLRRFLLRPLNGDQLRGRGHGLELYVYVYVHWKEGTHFAMPPLLRLASALLRLLLLGFIRSQLLFIVVLLFLGFLLALRQVLSVARIAFLRTVRLPRLQSQIELPREGIGRGVRACRRGWRGS